MTSKKEKKVNAKVEDPLVVDLKPPHQPNRAEVEEEIDMPGWSLDQVRETFMRPFMAKDS